MTASERLAILRDIDECMLALATRSTRVHDNVARLIADENSREVGSLIYSTGPFVIDKVYDQHSPYRLYLTSHGFAADHRTHVADFDDLPTAKRVAHALAKDGSADD